MSKLINLKLILIILLILPTYSCGGKWGADARKVSPSPKQRVKKNLEEGRGFRVNDLRKKSTGTNYEFEFDFKRKMENKSITLGFPYGIMNCHPNSI